jgi:predicted nucleic acid-binding protein
MKWFVDSSAWIALADRSDQYHRQAAAFLARLAPSDTLHTSNYVFGETVTRLRRTAGHHVAWQWAERCRQSRLLQIHYADEALDALALRLFKKYADHSLSFADCSTVVFMEQLRIERVVAFDEDFLKLGLAVFP